MDLQNISWVMNLLQSYLINNKKHPASRFSIGSEKTLKHAGIENEVYNFFQNYYSTQGLNIVAIINSDQLWDPMETPSLGIDLAKDPKKKIDSDLEEKKIAGIKRSQSKELFRISDEMIKI
jgi:secreted Zn-dependent insulinase-like peptidase